MHKKIISLLLVIGMLITASIPFGYAAEIINVDSMVSTKFLLTSYTDHNYAAGDSRIYAQYTSFGVSNWMGFTLNVKEAGKYEIHVYAANNQRQDGILTFTANDESVVRGNVARTGSWTDFSNSFYIGDIELKKGENYLRMSGGGIGIHINSIELRPIIDKDKLNDFSKKEGAYKEVYLPTVISAENFDHGTEGSYSVDGDNKYKKYRKDAVIDINDAQGNYYITLAKGDFVKYTFNVENAAVYKFYMLCGGTAEFSVYFDDCENGIRYDVREKHYSNTTPIDIYLEEGVHSIKIVCDEYIFNSDETALKFDEISFEKSAKNKEESFKVSDFMDGELILPYKEEPDYDLLDKENDVYKNIYVDVNGNDASNGSKEAPFKTVERAIKELETLTDDMTGDIIINIGSGVHFLEKTMDLSNAHSGKNGYNVIFRGVGKDTTTVSGGQQVTGWEKHDDYLWKAPVDAEEIRNLYINDYPATRAKSKYRYRYKETYWEEGSISKRGEGVIIDSTNFVKFARPQDLETYWPSLWNHFIHPVENIIYNDDGTATLIMDQPSWSYNHSSAHGPMPGKTFYLENAMELLDEPGEFYYNKEEKVIYYYPYKAQDMTKAETYVGRVEEMVDLRGESKESRAGNIVFENFAFKHGMWNEPSYYGLVMRQADDCVNWETLSLGHGPEDNGIKSPGQVRVNNAENVVIKDCLFTCLGSAAIQFQDSVKNVKVEGNLIRDVSGTGIIIGTNYHSTFNNELQDGNVLPCENFMVRNNVIKRAANEYFAQTGISVYYETNINIINNYLDQLPYTGITAGWGWESDSTMRSDLHKNIKVLNNRFGRTMNYLGDGGSLYTLGNLGGMEIAYNHFEDWQGGDDGVGGIYNDAGSSNLVAHHNVIEAPRRMWVHMQIGYKVDNNRYYENYSVTPTWDRTPGTENIEINEAIPLAKGKYPQEALDIMADAGVEDEYKHLCDEALMPEWMKWRVKTSPILLFNPKELGKAKFGWIEAEDYIPGSNGETYYDDTNGAYNNTYRKEGVNLLDVSTRDDMKGRYKDYVIQIVANGEWMTYRAEVPEDGMYVFKTNYGHTSSAQYIDVYIDNKIVVSRGKLPSSGSYYTMKAQSFGPFELEKGEHTIKYVYNSGGHFLDAVGLFPADGSDVAETEDAVIMSPAYDEGKIVLEQPPVVEATFKDIDGHYAEKDILLAKEAKIINGYDGYTFGPDDGLTKQQAALICMRAGKISHNEEAWEETAFENGLILEKGTGKELITREEFSHMVVAAYASSKGKYSLTMGETFKDSSQIDEKYNLDVLAAKQLGLLVGDENGNFRPKDGLTRAEAAVVAVRLAIY